jgi:hypothetical protein
VCEGGSGNSSFVGGEFLLDLLVLGLGWAETESLISVSVWIISILWAFSTPSLEFWFLGEEEWVW